MREVEAPVGGDGYLYVATGAKYLREAEVSARSLRRFTTLPICLVTDDASYRTESFTHVRLIPTVRDFVSKIVGMRATIFDRTVFLDSDTFVCSSIDNLFEVLDRFDMSMTPDNVLHSYSFWERYNPGYKLRFEGVLPEYNTGVVVYRSVPAVTNLLADWERLHNELKVKADMPSFREAYLEHIDNVRIAPLPIQYNFHGIRSFGVAYDDIKVIHERLGERWDTLTALALPFEKMDRIAKRVNRSPAKRLIVPYVGVIPGSMSPFNLKRRLKRLLGVRATKKADTY